MEPVHCIVASSSPHERARCCVNLPTAGDEAVTIVRVIVCKIRSQTREMLTITDIISSNWNQNVTVILTKCRLRRGRGDAKSRQLEWYHVQSAGSSMYTAPLYRDEWTKQMRHQFWWRPATLAARIGQPLPGMHKILFKIMLDQNCQFLNQYF